MLDEITELFAMVPPGTVVDATLGGGGHSASLLRHHPQIDVLGIDQDAEALDAATEALSEFATACARAIADSTSSPRRSTTTASTRSAAPCSTSACRHRSSTTRTAASRTATRAPSTCAWTPISAGRRPTSSTVTTSGNSADVIRRYGDERFARRIARAIVAARPLQSTTELAEVVTTAIPAAARRTGGHPAKRTFQAIRIEVNGELEVLPSALDQAVEATRTGGRIAVLAYHSGEDRIVKERFAVAAGACECPPDLPCVCGAVQTVRLVRGVPKRPSIAEREANRRAASARLRVVEKIDPIANADRKDR